MAHIGSRDPSPAPYPCSPESRRQKRRERKKSGKGKGRQTREPSLAPSRPTTPQPQPPASHATPHSSDGSTPRGRTGNPAGPLVSPLALRPQSLPASHPPMASPQSSHHVPSGRASPRASTSTPPTAPTAQPAATTQLPPWASYLGAPHPTTGSSTAAQAGLIPPAGMPTHNNPPSMENLMQMIFDTQASIGVLSTAVGELVARMNQILQTGPLPAQVQSVKSTKSMVACPKPWDGKGDSAAARHFLAAFANWATSQKEKMNRQTVFGVWVKRDMDWIQAALNLMEGDARTWCLPALEKLREDKEPYDGDWSKFEEEFTKRFIPQDPGEAAREALKRLSQGKRSVAEYKAKFEEHGSLTGWSKADLRSRFYDGLSDTIKDALAISDHPTEAYESLVEAAQALDIHLRQRQAEKKGQTFHQTQQPSRGTESVPMDLDASRQQHQGC